MFSKILIANRGEIACRIIRACREMNIQTVAVYSTADKDALHTQLADEAVCIGGPSSQESYLNIQNILSAAIHTGAEAIHPGFGFLAENSSFAKMCEETHLVFIGPKSQTIALMGNKAAAREQMIQAGVPVVPGTVESLKSLAEGLEQAEKVGFPLLIKAASGGGGKGMRLVHTLEAFEAQYKAAVNEAVAAFGDGDVYLERFVSPAKHIEVQLLADQHQQVIHLGERDCSLQRKNQKMIEEAPAKLLAPDLRERICQTAVKAAQHVGYQNAGTIEFLVDQAGEFFFMEMNTRIQVEHPVTEMITQIDLVKEQIKIAAGKPLSFSQEDVHFRGHAIECRINAENPLADFRPSPGQVDFINLPVGGLGLRVETALFQGYQIPPFYDSMIAKVIVHAQTREEAIAKMNRALGELVVEGVDSNQFFLEHLLQAEAVVAGEYDTNYIETSFMPAWQALMNENDAQVEEME